MRLVISCQDLVYKFIFRYSSDRLRLNEMTTLTVETNAVQRIIENLM